MTDEYWFWLTFPGGVVIGLVILGPFTAGYFFWQWYKADKEKQDRKKIYEEHLERIRSRRQSSDSAPQNNNPKP